MSACSSDSSSPEALVDGVTVTGEKDQAPTITVDSSKTPPSELVTKDIYVGEGTPVAAGDTVNSHYTGVTWSTGQVFDSSWERGQPISFSLAQVIPGWQQGLVGMKPGGRRLLVIPPDLGYGAQGSPPAIPPNSTLVFVVDLVKDTK